MRVDGKAPAPHTLPVGKDRQMFLIFPAGITYVDVIADGIDVYKRQLCAYGLLRFLANSILVRGFYKGVSNVHCLSLLSFP